MAKDLEEIEFVIFDTETTGLDAAYGDRIVEIAGIRFKGKERINTFQALVNPGRPVSSGAFAVNKISQEMLSVAPPPEKIIPDFMKFIQGACLCSYNAAFDMEFLENELKIAKAASPPEENIVVDVLKMAKRLLPGLERYALWFVADKLGVKQEQEHRAFSDVQITLSVFEKLKDILYTKGVFDFLTFSGLFAINAGLLKDINTKKLGKIQEAIDLGVKLKIRYLSSSGAEVTEREVLPKEIKQENNRSYLVGYCCLRKEERTFRTDGILHLEII
ncbi:MAG: exonuclease domain-containing protein [Candidatus Omnitrophota bacterium]